MAGLSRQHVIAKSCRGFSFPLRSSKACWGHLRLEGRLLSRRHSGGWRRWNVHCCVSRGHCSKTTGQRRFLWNNGLATGVSPVLIMSRRFLRKTAPPDLIRKLRGPTESRQIADVQTFCPGSLIRIISLGLTLGSGFAYRSYYSF